MEHIILDFYKDIYRKNIIKSDGVIGFRNSYFNNAIMSPNFLQCNKLNRNIIEEHRNTYKLDQYWLNVFNGKHIIKDEKLKKGLSLQYVLNNKKIHNPHGYEYRFEVVGHLFGKTKNDFMKMTCLNSFGLDLDTQELIGRVVQESSANIEYLVAYHGNNLIGGFTILHGKDYSLFINGSLSRAHRDKGVFKKMLATGINHSIDQGKLGSFYWTLNEKLKNKGNSTIELDIYNYC